MAAKPGTNGIHEFDRVVLTADVDGGRFRTGDVGTVVHIHGQGTGYEIEFFALNGETIDVATVDAAQVRKVSDADITHARRMAG